MVEPGLVSIVVAFEVSLNAVGAVDHDLFGFIPFDDG